MIILHLVRKSARRLPVPNLPDCSLSFRGELFGGEGGHVWGLEGEVLQHLAGKRGIKNESHLIFPRVRCSSLRLTYFAPRAASARWTHRRRFIRTGTGDKVLKHQLINQADCGFILFKYFIFKSILFLHAFKMFGGNFNQTFREKM